MIVQSPISKPQRNIRAFHLPDAGPEFHFRSRLDSSADLLSIGRRKVEKRFERTLDDRLTQPSLPSSLYLDVADRSNREHGAEVFPLLSCAFRLFFFHDASTLEIACKGRNIQANRILWHTARSILET